MTYRKIAWASSVAVLALSGCASMTPTYETQEAYVVLDGKAAPTQQTTERLLNNITTAVKSNVSSVRTNRNIPQMPLPLQAGNFSLKEPFSGSNLGALMQASASSFKLPSCDQPIMTLQSDDSSMARYGERSRFFVCVMPFAAGYRTAVYASYSRASGGFSTQTLGATIGRQIVGDSSQFIPRVINDIKKAMTQDLGKVEVVQSYVPDSFAGPMVDQRNDLQSKQ